MTIVLRERAWLRELESLAFFRCEPPHQVVSLAVRLHDLVGLVPVDLVPQLRFITRPPRQLFLCEKALRATPFPLGRARALIGPLPFALRWLRLGFWLGFWFGRRLSVKLALLLLSACFSQKTPLNLQTHMGGGAIFHHPNRNSTPVRDSLPIGSPGTGGARTEGHAKTTRVPQ